MAKKWIKGATEDAHGQFAANAKAAGKTTAAFADEHEHSPGVLGKQARLAKTLLGMHHRPKAAGRSLRSKAQSRYGS